MKFLKPALLGLFLCSLFSFVGFDRNHEELTVDKKKNFHLYLLMGQSNMAGRGEIQSIDTLVHPRVYMLDSGLQWVPAKDPMHFDKPAAGVGLGLTFGKIMADDNPKIKIGLIPTAVGGSSIDAWFTDSLHQQTNTYPYNDMIIRAKKAMKDGRLKGILWHQGESDSGDPGKISGYPEKFHAMMDSLKKDLGIQTVPVVMGEIGYFFYEKSPMAEKLNGVFLKMTSENECIELVSSELLHDKGDKTHFDSDSYHELGKRYAMKMKEIQSLCPIKMD